MQSLHAEAAQVLIRSVFDGAERSHLDADLLLVLWPTQHHADRRCGMHRPIQCEGRWIERGFRLPSSGTLAAEGPETWPCNERSAPRASPWHIPGAVAYWSQTPPYRRVFDGKRRDHLSRR